MAVSFFVITGQSEFPGVITVLPVLATAALIVAGTQGQGAGFRVLSTKPVVLVGDWSYSIYLWHWPFVSLAKVAWEGVAWIAPVAALVSFLPAIAAYYLVEQRYRDLEFGRRKQLAWGLTGFIGIPVVVSALLWVTPTLAFGSNLGEAHKAPINYIEACHVEPELGAEPAACVFDPDPTRPSTRPSTRPICLIGDSNAAHYSDGLVDLAALENSPLTIMTARSCPFMFDAGGLSQRFPDGEDCNYWKQKVLERLFASAPGTVVISSSDSYWLEELGPLRLAGQDLTPDAEALVEDLEDAFIITINRVRSAGHRVVLVQTVPHWVNEYEWALASCSLVEVVNGCHETMPAQYYLTRSGDVRAALSRAVGVTGATEVDFLDVVCPEGTCHTKGVDHWNYRDQDHLSAPFSRALTPMWVEILRSK